MLEVRPIEDLEAACRLWLDHWPRLGLFDLWPVRACFQGPFGRRPLFLAAERSGETVGLLALSWIEEEGRFGHFPGETWHGETWLEQNRIVARDEEVRQELLARVPGPVQLRYLCSEAMPAGAEVDEVGYLFFPQRYGYSYDTYLQEFSGKSRKKLGRELDAIKAPGLVYRHDRLADVDYVFSMNLSAFEERSYFHDHRFLSSVEALVAWLETQGMLRVTTVLLGGKVAAVDIGAVWGSSYTLLAGGVNPEFPGVAKLINFHHLEWACARRLEMVDFLCGDFGWKARFHLTPRPLYKLEHPGEKPAFGDDLGGSATAYVV